MVNVNLSVPALEKLVDYTASGLNLSAWLSNFRGSLQNGKFTVATDTSTTT